jgi:hypothetical protein
MRATAILTVGLLCSSALWASCRFDVGGTFKTRQPELRLHNSIACESCREINHHPEDIRNFMWNWVVLGRGGTMTPGTGSLGHFIFNFRMNQQIIVTPIFGDDPGANVMSVPVCNDHGQCATGTIDIHHNLIGVRSQYGFTLGINTGIREIEVTASLPNGEKSIATYSVAQMQSHLAIARFKLPVPSDFKRDFADDDDCLNNFGQHRPPDSEMVPTGPSITWGDSGDDPYEHWWEEEEAYGGRVPEHRCGISSVPGGRSTRSCGWFYF